MPSRHIFPSALLLALAVPATAADNTFATGYGPSPTLPAPSKSLVPTVDIAPAKGWAAGQAPIAASGFKVAAFATGLDHPRWLYVLPNGDVLVAETNAPPRPDDAKGIKGAAMKQVQK